MKNLLTTFLLLFSIQFCFATHNLCGSIKAKSIGYLQYEATIMTYTNVSSFPADRDSLQITWGDGVTEWIVRDTAYIVDSDIKFNSYTWQHTYNAEGYYTISLTDPNRTGGIINLPFADQIPFHIQTKVLVSDIVNETPVSLNSPISVGMVGQIYQSNPNVYDADGDSVSFRFQIPMQGIDTEVSNYIFPDLINPGMNNSIEINGLDGTITWDAPQSAARYVIAIKMTEYRDGIMISETIHDCELTILSSTNSENLLLEKSVEIFPNPSSDGIISVKLDENFDFENIKIEIYNSNGKLVMSNPGLKKGDYQSFDIRNFPKGGYVLIVQNKKGILSRKFIYN